MQHDARARGSHRMAERNRPAVYVELFRVELAHRAVEPQLLAAIPVFLPRGEAAEDLGRERLIDLPRVEVVELQAMALENRRGGVHRSEPHLGRVESRPLRVEDAPERLQVMALHRFVAGEYQPRRAVGDLRGISGGDIAVLAVEKRP